MATTVSSFSAIDDTAIDAESPIVESMMKQMRDNSYWVDPTASQTVETSTTKVLTPDGSGSVAWVEIDTIGGVDGTKGLVTTIGAWATLTASTNGLLRVDVEYYVSSGAGFSNIRTWIDLSDDSFVSVSSDHSNASATSYSGSITTGSTAGVLSTYNFEFRRDSGNLQYRISTGSLSTGFSFIWAIL